MIHRLSQTGTKNEMKGCIHSTSVYLRISSPFSKQIKSFFLTWEKKIVNRSKKIVCEKTTG